MGEKQWKDRRQRSSQNNHRHDMACRSGNSHKQNGCASPRAIAKRSRRAGATRRKRSEATPREARKPAQYKEEAAAASDTPEAAVRSMNVASHEAVVFSTPTSRKVRQANRAMKRR